MKKLLLRFSSVFVCLVLVLNCFYIEVNAAAFTPAQFDAKLGEVKEIYPDGSQQYEWKVNDTVVGWQCHGYARWLSFYVWGTDFANGSGKGWTRYNATASATPINKLVPGDVLRFRTSATKNSNHSIFVTKILGDTVYFTDCNYDGNSTIKWERSISKSSLEEKLKMPLAGRDYVEYGYIAHYTDNTLTPTYALRVYYNTGGGVIKNSDKTVTRYTVVESDGLNLRSGAGTSYSVLTVLNSGAIFTVSETATANGYTWGKTTYNGFSGWCVISKHWTTSALTPASTYFANENGNIYLSATGEEYTQTMLCGTYYKTGFVNASTLGLNREGYTFKGWVLSDNPDKVYGQNDAVTPEKLFGGLTKGDITITLYAKWQENIKTTGDINGDGKIDLEDITLLSKLSANWEENYDSRSVDVNGDGKVNLADVLHLSRYLANWENVTLPLK